MRGGAFIREYFVCTLSRALLAPNFIKQFWWLPELNRRITGHILANQVYVTSYLIGQN